MQEPAGDELEDMEHSITVLHVLLHAVCWTSLLREAKSLKFYRILGQG